MVTTILNKHQIRGRMQVLAAALHGTGSHKRSAFSQTPVRHCTNGEGLQADRAVLLLRGLEPHLRRLGKIRTQPNEATIGYVIIMYDYSYSTAPLGMIVIIQFLHMYICMQSIIENHGILWQICGKCCNV